MENLEDFDPGKSKFYPGNKLKNTMKKIKNKGGDSGCFMHEHLLP